MQHPAPMFHKTWFGRFCATLSEIHKVRQIAKQKVAHNIYIISVHIVYFVRSWRVDTDARFEIGLVTKIKVIPWHGHNMNVTSMETILLKKNLKH